VEEPGGGFFVLKRGGDVGTDVGDEVGAEPNGGVVRFDGVLDADDVDVRGGAGAVLLVAAEEVGVFAASGIDGVLDDQALSDPGLITAATEQGPFQVMVVHATTFSGGRARVDDELDALEEVDVDEGLVASFDLLAVVGDVAEVVAVAQHHGQLVDRDLPGGV
jgi:hypothetical protein